MPRTDIKTTYTNSQYRFIDNFLTELKDKIIETKQFIEKQSYSLREKELIKEQYGIFYNYINHRLERIRTNQTPPKKVKNKEGTTFKIGNKFTQKYNKSVVYTIHSFPSPTTVIGTNKKIKIGYPSKWEGNIDFIIKRSKKKLKKKK